jgi:hypothetical protein
MRRAPLTQPFSDSLRSRLRRDPIFRAALVTEAGQCLASGEIATGEILLREAMDASTAPDTTAPSERS